MSAPDTGTPYNDTTYSLLTPGRDGSPPGPHNADVIISPYSPWMFMSRMSDLSAGQTRALTASFSQSLA